MKKVFTSLVSATALFGLAACGDTDDTTTQGVDPAAEEQPLDDQTTQGVEPDDPNAAEPVQPAQ